MKDYPQRFSWLRACILLAAAATLQAQQAGDPGPLDPSKFDARRPLAQELKTSVADGFNLVAVGDCIISRPLSQYGEREKDFAEAVRLLKSGDATYGNLETSI